MMARNRKSLLFPKGPGMSNRPSEKPPSTRTRLFLMLGGALLLAPLCFCAGHLWGADAQPASPATQPATTAPATQPAGAAAPGKPRPKPITEVYYYDIITGKLFPAPVKEFPPIATPDKSELANGMPAGVKANVFSCGQCTVDQQYIGYLETYLPSARQAMVRMTKEMEKMAAQPAPAPGGAGIQEDAAMAGPSPQEMMMISEGHLVASQEDVNKWYKQESPEGAALVNAAMKKCPDNKYPRQCFPTADAMVENSLTPTSAMAMTHGQ
jgi:hypothetical protein